MTLPGLPPPGPRSSPFPRWSPAASLARLTITLGVLTLLGAALIGSLERVDVAQLQQRTSQVTQPLGSARHLHLTLDAEISQTLRLSGGEQAAMSARLSASRADELILKPRLVGGDLQLTLSRKLRELPLLISLDGASGLPGQLDVRVPPHIPLSLTLKGAAQGSLLDLHDLNLERLTFSGVNGSLRALLPERGAAQLSLTTTNGDLTIRLLGGSARLTLSAGSTNGAVTLRVPPSARVVLAVQGGAAALSLPSSFVLQPASDRRTRRYRQAGRAGGPRLSAQLTLTNGPLRVETAPDHLGNGVSL